ncbi:MAG: chitobiase/beta-hexosaminidase C-terminal domain-containing protein, partial [Bacteroidales bacterium]|nr:chitobiase/beta-hexosaminidase C-terminal domain-containing protein [Bacteroidales bacterium]
MEMEKVPDFSTVTTEEELEETTFMLYDDDDKITLEAFDILEEDLAEGDAVVPLMAAAAVIDGEGNITWSTTTKATFTVKGEETPGDEVAQPVITPDASVGAIKLNQKVTITCATEGASIYYTLDGSTPDATKTLYEAPFLLPEGTPVGEEITIKAIAIKDGVSSSVRMSNLMVEEAGEGPDDPVTPPTPAEKPNAPKFEVNGVEVTAATLAVSA